MSQLYRECQQVAGGDESDVFFIGHQANLTMLQSIARRCKLPENRHLHNIVDYGNQAAAGAPAVLSQRWDELSAGDRFAMVVVGSGLSWSSLLINVEE